MTKQLASKCLNMVTTLLFLNGTGNRELDMIHLSGPQVESLERLLDSLWVSKFPAFRLDGSPSYHFFFGQARPGPPANMNDKWEVQAASDSVAAWKVTQACCPARP